MEFYWIWMTEYRPNIGVTGPDRGGRAAWWFTWFAVFLHGGRAIRIQPKKGLPDKDIHGLIIGGGADINPQRYGAEEIRDLFSKDEKASSWRKFFTYLLTVLFFPFIYLIRKIFSAPSEDVDNNRDELEFELIKQAVDNNIPILGICRGAQLLNIHFGGTLHQDISSYYTEVPGVHSVWPKKRVAVDENSMLYEILTYQKVWVNALHHQAVDELGKQLAIVAREDNGIVQAIEHPNREFILGVQWHPEYMPQIPAQRRIFKQLVAKAKQTMKN